MKKLKKNNAFTLIEILVVATIIALLAGAGVVSYSQFLRQSRDAKRKADLEQIRVALEMYRSNNNAYITNTSQNDNCANVLNYLILPTKYIEKIPIDPRTGYYYRCNITAYSYVLGAYLESQASGTICGFCGASSYCNYCVGPYGQM
jgi:prepilin-type N-terminal cleavage/methylation domain-containing protein